MKKLRSILRRKIEHKGSEDSRSEQWYGFIRKRIADKTFAVKIHLKKNREDQKELQCVFVDPEKVYVMMQKEEL